MIVSATVGFSDVTSANIVGYMDNQMKDGFKAAAPTFMKIGSVQKGFYLSEVVPSGADTHTATADTIELQTLNEKGLPSHYYMYHKGDNPRKYPTDGWYENTTLISGDDDVFFQIGTGFWLSGNAKLKFTTAGEVNMDSLQIDLADGFRLVANPFAASINLSTIEPSGADTHTATADTIELQTLNEKGLPSHYYMYHKGDNPRKYPTDGWYENTTLINGDTDVEIKAGESVWVSGNSKLKLTLVTPFEDAE